MNLAIENSKQTTSFDSQAFLNTGVVAGHTAITPTTILVIDKIEVLRVVHLEHDVEPTGAKDY